MLFGTQRLGENVCSLILCRTILQLNSSIFYKLSDEVTVCINMFGTLVEDWILGKFHYPLIVTEQGCRLSLLHLHIW